MDTGDYLRLRQGQQIIVALLIASVRKEAFSMIVLRVEPMGLNHGAHCAIKDQNALVEQTAKQLVARRCHGLPK